MQPGDKVTVKTGFNGETVSGYSHVTIQRGQVGTVTSARVNKSLVRFRFNTWPYTGSVWVENSNLTKNKALPPERKLGVKPEGDHLDVDDPRIMWIWDDIATYAKGKSWCGTYDRAMEDLGLPGPVKTFNITRQVHGLPAVFKVEARTKAQAERILDEKLNVTAEG